MSAATARSTGRTKRAGAEGEQRRRAARFKSVFSTAGGKQVLDDLLGHLNFGDRLFSTDQRVQDANVARNDVAVWILEQINWTPPKGGNNNKE
jgi:hypothetical protein